MGSEIEKMYENANLTNLYCGDEYVAERMLEFECTDGNKEKCKTCDKVKTSHPSFTAEKQIELVKFLMEQEDFSWTITQQGKDTEYAFYVGYEHSSGGFKEFTEALAGIINNLWQDLTEEECKQIKEILE